MAPQGASLRPRAALSACDLRPSPRPPAWGRERHFPVPSPALCAPRCDLRLAGRFCTPLQVPRLKSGLLSLSVSAGHSPAWWSPGPQLTT